MTSETSAAVAAAQAGDEAEFGRLAQRYRPELQAHCYRMLGSVDESQDLVQETYLRAWRYRTSYQGRSTFRAWLYRIATNVCLDALSRHAPARQQAIGEAAAPAVAVPWLRPYPDRALEMLKSGELEPDAAAVSRETLELAFIAALQYLPARQRAALVLRDVLDWSAKDTASALETTVASANSALQRARATLKTQLPRQRGEWARTTELSATDRDLLHRYMDALERADTQAVAALLAADARVSHQGGAGGNLSPEPVWYQGRDTIMAAWAPILEVADAPDMRLLATSANRQPAVASYIRTGDDPLFQRSR